MTKLAVLISGNGSNLQAIIDAIRVRALPAEIAVVISNRRDAFGLERAAKAGIPTRYFPLKQYTGEGRSREAYDADLAALVKEYSPNWVVLAGWMHILSDAFLRHYPYRVVNLHPALPGKFPGAHAIDEAFAAYQRGEIKGTGCMVHLVPDEAVDAGPVIGTADVPIYPRDTLEQLSQRMHQAEHSLLVQSLNRLMVGDEDVDDDLGDDLDE
ncbi:MAG: phosphoribosylglycinamide formyltransferase [Anaerolineales bacterium]|nr:phosphoribosylglycinamide formyltransferase [Anaerolineales bacterium]